jgi:hypothetical protein
MNKITLEQWELRNSAIVRIHPSGCRFVITVKPWEQKSLFDLSDYAVSTVSGPTYWLVKKPEAKNP